MAVIQNDLACWCESPPGSQAFGHSVILSNGLKGFCPSGGQDPVSPTVIGAVTIVLFGHRESQPVDCSFDAEFSMSPVTFRPAVRDSGRLVLRDERHRKICRQFCQINRILAIADMSRKPTLPAIILITAAKLSPKRSPLRSM